MAGGIPLPALRRDDGMVYGAGIVAVPRLSASSICHRGHHLSRQPLAPDDVVPGHVACGEPEERSERLGAAAGTGTWQLQDRMDHAPQTAAGHGTPGTRPVAGRRRGGRNILGQCGGGPHRSADGNESADCSCGGRRRGGHRTNPAEPHPGSDQADLARFHRPGDRAGKYGSNRRAECLPGAGGLRARPAGPAAPSGWRTPVAEGASRGVAAEALADGHSSGSGWPRTPRLLLGRICVSIQPPQVGVPGQVVLPTGPASRAGGSRPLRLPDQTTTHRGRLSQVNTPVPN